MKRSLLMSLCVFGWAAAASADDSTPPTASPPGQEAASPAVAAARAACEGDVQKFCAAVPPGGGRVLACLKQHKDQVSDTCKQAVAKALKGS